MDNPVHLALAGPQTRNGVKASGAAAAAGDAAALALRSVSVAFGGVRALTDITLDIEPESVVAIIGPNGAGKTTLLNAICRLVPVSGAISLSGRDITKMRPSAVATAGIARSFQDPQLLETETVLENVLCGAHGALGYSMLDQVVRRWRMQRAERNAARAALDLLEIVGVADLASTPVSELSYGTRKIVDIVRASLARPSLLLLDEPSSGLDRNERERVEALLVAIHERFRNSMLIVEHHMDVVEAVSSHLVALVSGSVALNGPTREVMATPAFKSLVQHGTLTPDQTTTEGT